MHRLFTPSSAGEASCSRVLSCASPTTLLALLLLLLPSASAVPFHGWDVYYGWTLPEGPDASLASKAAMASSPWSVNNTFQITLDPGVGSYYYWSHYIFFSTGSNNKGATGAYWGLQTNGAYKSLIFSVWGGTSGVSDTSAAGKKINAFTGRTTSFCKPFEEDGDGHHCLYTYDWKQGVKYIFRTSVVSRNATGDVLKCSMYDPVTQKWVPVGTIGIPTYIGYPATSVYFYEDYGSRNCKKIPKAAATFSKLSLEVFPSPSSRSAANGSGTQGSGLKARLGEPSPLIDGTGGACGGWATLTFCGDTASGTSPANPLLTTAPKSSCPSPPPAPPVPPPALPFLNEGVFVPAKFPGAILPLSASSLKSIKDVTNVKLSNTGSVLSGTWMGPKGQAFLPAVPFLSTSFGSQTSSNATWILVTNDGGATLKMVQIQVYLVPTPSSSSSSSRWQVLVYSSGARYNFDVPRSPLNRTSANAAWQAGTSTGVATSSSSCCYGVAKLAYTISSQSG